MGSELGDDTIMGDEQFWEQPIFTTKAHVFQIDPNTKKKWLPASTQAINVSYYYDSTRNSYRIISVEGSKAVINSTITPNMTFTKTSQKFGQWSDSRANTVYGLGFSSEGELVKFVEKFKEVKELTRQAQGKSPQTNGTENHSSSEGSNANTGSPVMLSKPSSLSSLPPHPLPQQNDTGTSSVERRNSGTVPSSSSEAQLKYENDRLKIALAQSSANAKKWEVELQTLKNNNARLTTALQESTANVEEWKKQLAAYKEESARMKKRVQELEKSGGGSDNSVHRQVGELSEKVHDLEQANRCKQEEISELTQKVEGLKPFETQNQKLLDRIQGLERENENLRSQVSGLKQQVDGLSTSHSREKQQLRGLREQIRSKVSELHQLDEQLGSTLQS